jgi:hypothetical protein
MAKHPVLKRGLLLGLVAGAIYAIWRAIDANRVATREVGWEPQPFPFPPQPRSRPEAPAEAPDVERDGVGWVEPVDGTCPASHPVKAKLGSGIYHVPGGFAYDRTHPDRCYLDAAAAESDGLRAAKR